MSNKIIYGIQGGKGSFNEQAIKSYLSKNPKIDAEIKYLYTTEKVLQEVVAEKVDFGQFAIHNSVGGMVEESIYAMAKYTFNIVEENAIIISHHLMKRKDADIEDIDIVMAHPQVFKQCKTTLQNEKYNKYKLKTGEGDLIDHAMAAKALSEGKLPASIAILGPKILSEMYDFDVIAANLQDNKQNFTSFLLVSM